MNSISKENSRFTIRTARPSDYESLGRLTVEVYSQLPGMPKIDEQQDYYNMLYDVEKRAQMPSTEILVAVDDADRVFAGVMYISDMQSYGSNEFSSDLKNASGIRLLAVHPETRGSGLGKALTRACIDRAVENGHDQVILHTTKAMSVAWKMYEKMGFIRAAELDFMQKELPVYGFRLELDKQ